MHTEAAQELGARVSLRRGRSANMTGVGGIAQAHAAGRRTMKGGRGLMGLCHGSRGPRLNTFSRRRAGLRSCRLRSSAWRHRPDGGPLSPRRPLPPSSTTRGRSTAGNREGNHSNWVLTRSHEACGAQPPFVEAGHLLHEVAPIRAKVQQIPPCRTLPGEGSPVKTKRTFLSASGVRSSS